MPSSETREPRFLTLADVAEILATSVSQVRALVKSRELRAIQIGGRGQWRVETVELEKYIARMYAQADVEPAVDPSIHPAVERDAGEVDRDEAGDSALESSPDRSGRD